MNVYEIINSRLYQSGMITDPKLIKSLGVEAIINVDHFRDDGVEAETLWHPFDDAACPSPVDLDDIAGWGVRQVLANRRLLVHCAAGMNRSSLVTGVILHKLYACGYLTDAVFATGEGIVRFIRSRRPGALMNWSFETYLRELGRAEG